MAKLGLSVISLVILQIQSITPYAIRPGSNPYQRCDLPRQYFEPTNIGPPLLDQSYFVPKPQTIITDCTPQVCKNLANTIQLMIVTNLLKDRSRGTSDTSLKMALPILRSVLASVQNSGPGLLGPVAGRGSLQPFSGYNLLDY